MIARKYICIDIGKTKILLSTLKANKAGFKFLDLTEKRNPRNPAKIKKIISDYCHEARNNYRIKRVAVSAAHIVDPIKKIVSKGKDCYGTDIFDFRFLEQAGYRVKIANDGHCFSLGEYHFGKSKKTKIALSLALGTEIGGGLIQEGKIYSGAHNSGFEVSRMGTNYSSRWIELGSVATGKGIENEYRKKTGNKISAKEIFIKAKKGYKEAKIIVANAAKILGMGIASLINVIDPEIVVFGGSLSRQKKYILEASLTARKNVFNKKANYKFAISALGNRANLLGAASLFF